MALSPQQIETRRSYIGGSDARTVLEGDAGEWMALYTQKIEGLQPVFPPAQQLLLDMGNAIEPLTLREFNRKIALQPIAPDLHIVWKDDPILAFTPDGLTLEDRLPVQCKFHTGNQSILELAETYKAQLIHEMVCSDTRRMYLAVIFGHYGRFQHMEVKFDEALADAYLMRAMQFKHYLNSGELPDDMAIEAPALKVERKRDHLWPEGDNEVAPLCRELVDNMTQHAVFDAALEGIKKIIKRKEYADCGSLTWRDAEGYGVTFKLDARGAVRYHLAFPPRGKKAKAKV